MYNSVTTATLNQKLQNQRLDSTEPCHLSLHRWLVSNRDLFLIFFLNSLISSLKSFKLLLRYLCKIVEILWNIYCTISTLTAGLINNWEATADPLRDCGWLLVSSRVLPFCADPFTAWSIFNESDARKMFYNYASNKLK